MTYDMGSGSRMTDPAPVVVVEVIEEEPVGMRVAAGPPVAAGAELSFAPITDRPFRLMVVTATLTTSAVVASRAPALKLSTRNGDVIGRWGTGTLQAAGQISHWTWSPDSITPGTILTDMTVGMPSLWLPDGAVIATETQNLNAGDQWSAMVVSFLMEDY